MMPARLYNNQRWTDEDDKLLRSMCEGGKSLTLITAKPKRPMTAIRARGSAHQHPRHWDCDAQEAFLMANR